MDNDFEKSTYKRTYIYLNGFSFTYWGTLVHWYIIGYHCIDVDDDMLSHVLYRIPCARVLSSWTFGQSITELRETMHRAHDITERVQPEHVMELWNMTNAILRRVPWEQLINVRADRDAAVNVKTKELVETMDRVIQDVQKLPIEHVLNVDMFAHKR